MEITIDLRVSELLAARLCHELVSPTGAIANGVELLGEDDPDFVKDAVALIEQSARKAGRRLQFYRFAYGTIAGGSGGPPARELLAGLLEDGKVTADWTDAALAQGPEWQRLACNLAVVATEVLPRGGAVVIGSPPRGAGITLAATGATVNLGPELAAALAGTTPVAELTSRTIQAYWCRLLARRLGTGVEAVTGADGLNLKVAQP